jgi:hypothetical protein
VTTAFEISRWSNGIFTQMLIDLAIGLGVVLAAVASIIAKGRSVGAWLAAAVMLAWAAFWLHHIPLESAHLEYLLDAYGSGRYEIVEGEVSVLRQQPAHGHTEGDRVVVGGKTFVVSYFVATPAYRDTIAHGGVLKPGAYARIYHRDGEILRVDLKKGGTTDEHGSASKRSFGPQRMRFVTTWTPRSTRGWASG